MREAEKNLRADLTKGNFRHQLQLARLLLEKESSGGSEQALRLAEEEVSRRPHPLAEEEFKRARELNPGFTSDCAFCVYF